MGTDKAALPWRGTTLLGHVLTVLADAVAGPLVVVGSADRPHPLDTAGPPPATARDRVVRAADPVADQGPLRGIATGLVAVAEDDPAVTAVFVASVDLPRLHAPFVRAVLTHRVSDVEVALPVLDGHRQPLAAAYAPSLGARAAGLLDDGEVRPAALFARSRVRELDAAILLADPALAAVDPGLRAARGVNTPAELATLTDPTPRPASPPEAT